MFNTKESISLVLGKEILKRVPSIRKINLEKDIDKIHIDDLYNVVRYKLTNNYKILVKQYYQNDKLLVYILIEFKHTLPGNNPYAFITDSIFSIEFTVEKIFGLFKKYTIKDSYINTFYFNNLNFIELLKRNKLIKI